MKFFKTLLFLFFCPIAGMSQETDKQMAYNLTLDTLLAPDYYKVQITTAEFSQYERISKKQYKNTIVPLDTLSKKLLALLFNMGFNQPIQKSTITEVENTDNYYGYGNNKKLFQVTYSFQLNSRDSIDYLFKNIDRQLVSGMKISPEISDTTVEKAKRLLVFKGLALTEKYAYQIAQQMNQKIIKSKYNIIFYDGDPYYRKFDDYNKKFAIDYSDINYRLSVSYTYSLSDK